MPKKRKTAKHKPWQKYAPKAKRIRRTDDGWEQAAFDYVEWLAKRDGVELPTYATHGAVNRKAIWSGVYSKTRFRKCRYSGRKVGVFEKRIQAVAWGRYKEVFNTRKDGRRGAYLYTVFVEEFHFEIPHWDWNPEPPIEETIDEDSGEWRMVA